MASSLDDPHDERIDLNGGRQDDPATRELFATRIVPHRSLTPSGFRLLMAIVAAMGLVSSVPFLILGAWPVTGFMGLDVLLLYWAFRANFAAARAYEDIVVTPIELQFVKVDARGTRAEWRFHPAWVRLLRQENEAYGLTRLALQSRRQQIEVAGFLGPDQKAHLATRLTHALTEARRGPRFS